MATLNTPDDLLLLLREDAAFRATMRRELLTVELLEVPQRISGIEQSVTALIEHANATNARLDRMDQTIAAIVEQTNAINARLDRMDQTIAAIVEQTNAINRRLDLVESDITVMKRDINGLGESFRREVRAQSSFRGNYAQSAASASDIDIAHLFAHRHGLEDIKTRHISRNNLEAWLRENRDLVKSLSIRQRATRTFLRPDIIAAVEDLYSSEDASPVYYIVIEASYTGDTEDVDRVTDHAKIVRAITGLEAYPVVAAVMLDDEMEQATRSRLYDELERFVDARDENGAYWHRLYSADLKPPEPR
ncbi:MAG: hypothetical protein F4Y44_03890 [Chloroflexi bacterium]|nr:hypothetical protein [Chloroflexota bacterium]